MAGKHGNRFQLSERQLGYAMVLPSILLILVVIIWPIMMSFWNSLFDYRLNDPARSERFLSPSLNLEDYADNQFLISQSLDQIGMLLPDADEEITSIESTVDSFHEKLVDDKEIKKQYDQVNEMLNAYQPVSDPELRYAEIEKSWSTNYNEALAEDKALVTDLLSDVTDEEAKVVLEQLNSQLESMKSSIIESNFVGLENYKQYLSNDRTWKAMWNTTFFTVVTVFFELILGLMIALIINRAFIGRGAVRAAVLIPWAVPTAVAAMMWGFLYDGQSGIVGHYLAELGIISDPGVLLTTGPGAMFSIILADVWKTTPYMALLLLAGLQTIPNQLYEAAQVDGAGKIQRFFKITLPLLKSSILVALLFRTLDAFRVFDLIYVLTGGGPANSTESISVYAYKTLFEQQNFGAGSALSVIVFVAVAIISTIFIKLIGSELFAEKASK